MALFKISKGLEASLPLTLSEGHAYFTTDKGNLYIDIAITTGDPPTKTISRIQVNAGTAKGLDDGSKQVEIDDIFLKTDILDVVHGGTGNNQGYIQTGKKDGIAIGEKATAEGSETTASGWGSHAEGFETISNSKSSHAEGMGSIAGANEIFKVSSFDVTNTIITLNLSAQGYSTSLINVKVGDQIVGMNPPVVESVGDESFFPSIGDYETIYRTTLKTITAIDSVNNTITIDSAFPFSPLPEYLIYLKSNAKANPAHAEGIQTIANGINSHAEGYQAVANGENSHAEGNNTKTTGINSHAEGNNTKAYGESSHTEGINTKTGEEGTGVGAHAEGFETIAAEKASHAEGHNATTTGQYSHAEGETTEARGEGSHAEGRNTLTQGDYSHAEGYQTIAYNNYSHAEGIGVQTVGDSSHGEGRDTTATGDYSHAEGESAIAYGRSSHAEGTSVTNNNFSHAEGMANVAGPSCVLKVASIDTNKTTVTIDTSVSDYSDDLSDIAIGDKIVDTMVQISDISGAYKTAFKEIVAVDTINNTVTVNSPFDSEPKYLICIKANSNINSASHAEGYKTIARGEYSHAEGNQTFARGQGSHSEGYETIARGYNSHAEGDNTIATGYAAHAEGHQTVAEGQESHAEGVSTIVVGEGSHAEGNGSIINGSYSHAEGRSLTQQNYSHAEGMGTIAGSYQVLKISSVSSDRKILTIGRAKGFYSYVYSAVAAGDTIIGITTTQKNAQSLTRASDPGTYKDSQEFFFRKVTQASTDNTSNIITIEEAWPEKALDWVITQNADQFGNLDYSAAHAEGNSTLANGDYSHAEGYQTITTGKGSHAEGESSITIGMGSHAEGQTTQAIGNFSHAEGNYAMANGAWSHTEGCDTVANGQYSHSEGNATNAVNEGAHAAGLNTVAYGKYSHTEGWGTIAGARGLFLINAYTSNTITVSNSLEGAGDPNYPYEIIAQGDKIFIPTITNSNTAIQSQKGIWNTVSSIDSNNVITLQDPIDATALNPFYLIVFKQQDIDNNYFNTHAEGIESIAFQKGSHAEGYNTSAFGSYSHAEGNQTIAGGESSHSEGYLSQASGNYSHAGGYGTRASSYQTVIGRNNSGMPGPTGRSDTSGSLFIIGNGTSNSSKDKTNAFRVATTGKTYGVGTFGTSGADYAEYFEWMDKNLDKEDRRGLFVTLDKGKIRLANNTDDFILGIISSNPSIVGNVQSEVWHGMYLTDIFGKKITETVEVLEHTDEETGELVKAHAETRWVLNPDYDPEQEYISREYRPEWAPVGLTGRLVVVDDGTCVENGYCAPHLLGVATKSNIKTPYRVMERLDDNHIEVFVK